MIAFARGATATSKTATKTTALLYQFVVLVVLLLFTKSGGSDQRLEKKIDGTLNGFPIYRRSSRRRPTRTPQLLYSSVQCVGENFASSPNNPYRSCHVTNLCFKHNGKRNGDGTGGSDSSFFLYYQSPEEVELQEFINQQQRQQPREVSVPVDHVTISSLASTMMIVRNNDNNNNNVQSKRFPITNVIPAATADADADASKQPYFVDDNVVTVLLPYSLLPSSNVSSSFRFWFAIYNLLATFGFDESKKKLLIILIRDENNENDKDTTERSLLGRAAGFGGGNSNSNNNSAFYLKAMRMKENNFVVVSNPRELDVKIYNDDDDIGNDNNIICSRYAVASYGLMGLNRQDANNPDESTFKVGQGATLWSFRNYMVKNLVGMNAFNHNTQRVPTQPPYKVTFFAATPSVILSKQLGMVRQVFESHHEVLVIDLSSSIQEQQLNNIAESLIFITVLDDGDPQLTMLMAAFLPRGSTLIVYDNNINNNNNNNNNDGRQSQQQQKQDVVELLNTAGYFQTYWLDMQSKDSQTSLKKLEHIIRNKLDLILAVQ